MHEFSVAQALLDAALPEAARYGATRITAVACRIGVLRQVDASLLGEAFAAVAEGTVCAGAVLAIERTFLHATCSQCGLRFAVRNWDWRCPHCHGDGVDPAGGDELELVSVDLEAPDESRNPAQRVSA